MAKTRSQTRNITIKKEEEDHKDTQLLHSVSNPTGNSNKITKRKSSRSKNSRLPGQQVKVEETTNTKPSMEALPTNPTLVKTQYISQEQIRQLIRYIVNDKMTLSTAASKLKIRSITASYYYNLYNNDPEKKIPMPLRELYGNRNACTQEQITKLIKHIVDDDMSVLEASALACMNYVTGCGYYREYKGDPNHNIPMQIIQKSKQEQINKLIGYIIDDKMSLNAASKKVKMGIGASKKYYRKYLDDPNHDIPVAEPQGTCTPHCTQDQVNRLISAIIDDKMTVVDAAKKANMTKSAGWKYYRKYKNDPNHCIPIVNQKLRARTIMSQDKIKQLISYIMEDKMTIRSASRKAKISYETGKKYYRKYRNDPNSISTTPIQSAITPGYTQEQIKVLISFIVDDKMMVKDASEKANMSLENGEKYYQQYLNDLYRDIPMPSHIVSKRRCTEEQINTLIRCVIDDKMTLRAASEKASMNYDTGIKYFQEYVNDPSNNASMPDHVFLTRAHKPEKVNAFISYVVNDKMSIAAASKKAGMGATAARNYYRRYINNLKDDAPARKIKYSPCTQEQIDNVIRYITEDKLSIPKASKRANMSILTGRKYYQRYLKDHSHTIP